MVNTFKSMRREEVALCVEAIRAAANSGSIVVDLSDNASSLSVYMSCRMVFGKKYMDVEFDGRGLMSVVKEGTKLLSAPNLGDYIPFLLLPLTSKGLQSA
ncbi:hypothetical protein L3X38_024208 [Prunus dulcis]|uniref:Uncharacterized protein n=1 Tax=Prunus dulcis TaxID=3755 RepID=A0AAD4Z5X7_PRUDU|nr:hypothetical protein L3X38_024208 [Prunus dulcis]